MCNGSTRLWVPFSNATFTTVHAPFKKFVNIQLTVLKGVYLKLVTALIDLMVSV